MRSSISFLFTKLKIYLFVSARPTSGNLTMVCVKCSKYTVNYFFFVVLSLSDLSYDAINFLNVAQKSEVSDFFLFKMVEEVDSNGDGVCDSEAILSSSSSSCSSGTSS
jgi:hypothetical protein